MTRRPASFGPGPAHIGGGGPLLGGAVSTVTKAPFYTRGLQRTGHRTLVLLGLAPVCRRLPCSWVSDLPHAPTNTLIGGGGVSLSEAGGDLSEGRGTRSCLQPLLESRINERTTHAKQGKGSWLSNNILIGVQVCRG